MRQSVAARRRGAPRPAGVLMTAQVKNNVTTRLHNQHKKLIQNPQQVVGPIATCGRAQKGGGLNILFRFRETVVLNSSGIAERGRRVTVPVTQQERPVLVTSLGFIINIISRKFHKINRTSPQGEEKLRTRYEHRARAASIIF